MGCGWLGLPLARAFHEKGFQVHGSTTSQDKLAVLKKAGIVPFLLHVDGSGIQGPEEEFLSNQQILIIAIPPGLRKGNGEDYIGKMKAVHRAVKRAGIDKVLFVSSTSVYGSTRGEITEETLPLPDTESGRQLLASEQLFRHDQDLHTIIVRFGGLIGPERHPVYFLSGKGGLKNGKDLANLIHLEDCIHLISAVINGGHWNEVFNGVYPAHPAKREYYTREARKRGLKAPEYLSEGDKKQGKMVISSNFLINNYSFFSSIFT
jgi:nucleoside-diphosphate-sugar epimerase